MMPRASAAALLFVFPDLLQDQPLLHDRGAGPLGLEYARLTRCCRSTT
jgi:hypothetical protein